MQQAREVKQHDGAAMQQSKTLKNKLTPREKTERLIQVQIMALVTKPLFDKINSLSCALQNQSLLVTGNNGFQGAEVP